MTARGRPPDPDLETRVHAAALELYGEVGWAGFSFDALARRAHVGKATLYGKWGSKEKLIVAALATGLPRHPEERAAGPLREDLLRMAGEILDSYLEPRGLVYLRAQIEARVYPELFGHALESFQRERIRIGRAVVVGAIDRGELPAGTSPALVLDAVSGILTNRFLSTPIGQMPALAARRDVLVEEIVDFVLSAVHYRDPGS
ncbi:TetR/AcrR family transcriptional regulator [Nonomuraea sp. MCN248]|uniref:TetR/AcrR family transcriptional regulator n=1 Tax=Nonomuraea corallina TaxID=2989783 RepID=A0ABT4SFA6_9ACTN|nr:TetR/AcrR family transcriptional regulator [Nonomuraea corallina]MDA0635887.1 TetR/AcrR family transcriptional regulator [Nonomuraea corallina]